MTPDREEAMRLAHHEAAEPRAGASVTSTPSGFRTKRLASEILSDKDAPPVLLLAACLFIYHGEEKPLRDLVEEAARGT